MKLDPSIPPDLSIPELEERIRKEINEDEKTQDKNKAGMFFYQCYILCINNQTHSSGAGNRKYGDTPDKSAIFLMWLLKAMFKNILIGPKCEIRFSHLFFKLTPK